MSIRTRLSSALHALLGEPVDRTSAGDLAATEIAYLRSTLARYSEHLDDIRNDLADAGIPIPENDDPELTPRRMVGLLVHQRDMLAAEVAPTKPTREIPEPRLLAILREIQAQTKEHGAGLTADAVADVLAGFDPFFDLAPSTVSDIVRAVSRNGFLLRDGQRPATYTLTDKGLATLAGERLAEAS